MHSESDFRLLPKFLFSKRAILNPRNIDHRSFGYSIMFYLHPNDWKIFKLKPHLDTNFEKDGLNKIKFPVLLEDIPALEEQLNIRISIYTFDDAAGLKRHSLYISPKYKSEEVNLLYWEGRYALIKYFDRLYSDCRKYEYFKFLHLFLLCFLILIYIFLTDRSQNLFLHPMPERL